MQIIANSLFQYRFHNLTSGQDVFYKCTVHTYLEKQVITTNIYLNPLLPLHMRSFPPDRLEINHVVFNDNHHKSSFNDNIFSFEIFYVQAYGFHQLRLISAIQFGFE